MPTELVTVWHTSFPIKRRKERNLSDAFLKIKIKWSNNIIRKQISEKKRRCWRLRQINRDARKAK